MQRVDPRGRCHFCEGEMCLVGIDFWPDQVEATGYAVDVGVNWHLWLSFVQMKDATVCKCSIVCCHILLVSNSTNRFSVLFGRGDLLYKMGETPAQLHL